ncbi:hypothetical protein TWF730_006285 [Orbilia blumenaviensis]|uniref:Uncharacterized protein n=1 Tax=Orbilia blumenaviensis TaxID=1796055 RepID=A0AAV9VDU1_9PEZI
MESLQRQLRQLHRAIRSRGSNPNCETSSQLEGSLVFNDDDNPSQQQLEETPSEPPQQAKKLTFTDPSPQSTSPLFSLPGELRNIIWEYALAPYNDPTRPYPQTTAYHRPDYIAPKISTVALLRTCKAVYMEAWYLPWTTAELGFYLTAEDRRPPKVETVERVQHILNDLHSKGVDTTTANVRVFAQLYRLEDGVELQNILGMAHFKPQYFTITIRHTDFWYWEQDATLRVGGQWVGKCRFPESVKVIRVEFESLERKKAQVDEIAQQAVENWRFMREDGRVLSAVINNNNNRYNRTEGGDGNNSAKKVEGEMEVMRWTGGSTWHGFRWLRDEIDHNKLSYYVKTVVWRLKSESDPSLSVSDNVWTREISATHVPGLVVSVSTTTEKELELVGTCEGETVAQLMERIRLWRAKNRRLASRTHRRAYERAARAAMGQ